MKALLKKLCAIQAEIESIEKTGYNEFQKYKYVKESDVLDAVRPLLIKHGVLLTMNASEITNIGDMTQVKITYTWHCIDSGESMAVVGFGQGCDKQDKGIYKAYTGGLKYFLMKSFLISSEDDPENEKEEKKQYGSTNNKVTRSELRPHGIASPAAIAIASKFTYPPVMGNAFKFTHDKLFVDVKRQQLQDDYDFWSKKKDLSVRIQRFVDEAYIFLSTGVLDEDPPPIADEDLPF